VAVFAGANIAFVPDENYGNGNPLVQEQLPVDSWGTRTLALSFAGRLYGDTYRVLAPYSNTVVTISTNSGVMVLTNDTWQSYEIIVDGPVEFEANQPIQVAQFANGTDFDGAVPGIVGDPCEILLPPTGHYLETNIVVSLPSQWPDGDFGQSYLNLIVVQSATNSTWVDGSLVAAGDYVAIGTSGYYGAQVPLTTNGVHIVTSSKPVGVQVYGFGGDDAYGYFGGIVK